MQFKASQKLLDQNQQKSSTKAETKKDEFEKLKDEANKLFKAEKYNECLEAYSQILVKCFSTMSNSEKAVIYSNRSAAYLMLNNQSSIKKAKVDAEKAIKFNPSWFRGYFRLGRVHAIREEWKDSEKSFEKALALNSESKETRDELSVVRAQIGLLYRQDYLDPSCRPKPKEEQYKEAAIRAGISQKQMEKLEREALQTPGYGDCIRGAYYRDGVHGVEQDYKKSFEYYMKAVKHNIPDAMFNIGRMYQNGFGVKRDYEESLKWLLKAAKEKPIKGNGVAEAQHLLGLNYSEGVGVDKDIKQAVQWYEKAVENGFAPSANNLGLLYQKGDGVEKSATKAFHYFKFAAQQGETPPMINLARCYFNADGTGSLIATPDDIAEGKKWLRLAAEKGDIRAAQELEERENMSPENVLLESLRGFMLSEKDEKKNPLNYEEYGKYVEEAAKKGSLTAQRHMEMWKHIDDAMKAFKKNDSAGVVAALSKAIRLDQEIVKIPDLFKPIIEERYKSHPNELDANVCFIAMNSRRQNPAWITSALKKYPHDPFLLEVMFACLSVIENKQGALDVTTFALELHPNSLRLRFCHALALMEFNDKKTEYIQALDTYLSMAPKDNDKVPECHYRKALHYGSSSKFIESYEAGLAAEKEQLPCFLPYHFKAKGILEKRYSFEKAKNVGSSSKKRNEPGSLILNKS
uniref:Uncharacterized protein n=1 Tax=Panagrolaimus davidi TaxID=227884 RepID=A0A914PVF7_9BILA